MEQHDNFVHLHVHSTYSFVDGYGLPEQYISRAKELGQSAIAVTDHGNISAHYKWYKTAKANGIKPILGCELYVKKDRERDEKRKYYHITALALNNEGYGNLLKLVTIGWQSGEKKPTVPMEEIIRLQKGILFTNGCPSGKVDALMMDGNFEDAEHELMFLKKNLEHFYIEVAPWSFEVAQKLIEPLYRFSQTLDIPLIATMDTHYVTADQSKVQEMLLCIQSGDTMDNPKRWKFDQEDFYLKSRTEMEESFKAVAPNLDFTESLDNTVKIAEMVELDFPQASQLRYPENLFEKKEDMFKRLCEEGLKTKDLDTPAYRARMEYEIELIIQKEFVDYFLIVWELVNWAKVNNILVGPARGSSAGSLVCYLLRITEVDPLVHGLIFERFIDINRADLPDIDVDFEDLKRPLIKRHLEEKYGADKVAAIGTYATFKGKQVINDFGRIYRLPFDVVTKLKSVMIERSGGDSRASFTIEDTFNQFDAARDALIKYPVLKDAGKFEAQLRNMSSHASGIVVSNEPLTNFCAVYDNKGEPVISMDYYDASSLGLVKIDILGLNTLSCISKALDLIKTRTGREIDIYNLPLDDPKVFEGFRDRKKLFGIFQFDGQATNQVCRQMQPENFEELSAVNALSRPGPMHGLDLELNQPITSIYIQRRQGKLPMKSAHPLLDKITAETQGVVIYQEQVMKTMREVGKMSWKDTAEIRKLISRSVGQERFNTFKDKFAVGARENGLKEGEIDNIWSAICTFGSWAFNKSHSVSYSIISYWTMWLKLYYPIEYYAAMASVMHVEEKIRRIIKEYVREGHQLLSVDVNKSKKSFSIDDGTEKSLLRLGFLQIKGIGEAAAEMIEAGQPYLNFKDFEERCKVTKKTKTLLSQMGAFEGIGGTSYNENTLFGIVTHEKFPGASTITLEDKMILCPLAVNFSVIDKWEKFTGKVVYFPTDKIEGLNPEANSQVIMGVVYDKNLKDKIEEALSRGKEAPDLRGGGSKYCNFILEDDTDFVTVRVSSFRFEEYKKLIFEDLLPGQVLMVKGRMGDGIRMFFANEIICLDHLKEKLVKKLVKKSEYSMSELVMMGKSFRNIPKRKSF